MDQAEHPALQRCEQPSTVLEDKIQAACDIRMCRLRTAQGVPLLPIHVSRCYPLVVSARGVRLFLV